MEEKPKNKVTYEQLVCIAFGMALAIVAMAVKTMNKGGTKENARKEIH